MKYNELDGSSQWWEKVTSWRKEQQKLKKMSKISKNVIIINFTTVCYKVTASGDIIHSILNYWCMRLVSILPKECEKNRQKEQVQKNWTKKVLKSLEKLTSMAFFFWNNITSKIHQIWTNIFKQRIFWEHP